MKPIPALLPDFISHQQPFVVREIVRPFFSTDFHFHQECQLVCVLEGTGRRIIGGSVEPFGPGDVTFTGPNVPHVWYSDRTGTDDPPIARSVALYIYPPVVLEHLSAFINPQPLADFFRQSGRGLSLSGSTRGAVAALLLQMQTESGLPLLQSFLRVMQQLITTTDKQWLNDEPLITPCANGVRQRVPRLMTYIQENFRTEISLQAAASTAGFEVHSFCRYFKALTQRTFSEFVNELRVGFASQLLQHNDLSITQVGYESGFTNISYFNRSFKRIRGVTPKAYRQHWQGLPDYPPKGIHRR